MTLGDIENLMLLTGQQPGVVVGTNPLPAPNWASLTNPSFSQGVVDFYINLGYSKLMGDVGYLEIVANSFSITTTTNAFDYTLTLPAGKPAISRINRIFYAPTGLNYTKEYKPGTELISWMAFQEQTGWGYFLQTGASSATLPTYWTVYPDRTKIRAYPGTANAGDTITIMYAPLPTSGATFCPTLVNAADVPVLPSDCHEAIFYWAMKLMWIRNREAAASDQYGQMYAQELERIKRNYGQNSMGDSNAFDLGDMIPGYEGAGLRAFP